MLLLFFMITSFPGPRQLYKVAIKGSFLNFVFFCNHIEYIYQRSMSKKY